MRDVNLPPVKTLARRGHKVMAIVVPAFAERQERERPQAGSVYKTAQGNFCFATAQPHTFRDRNSFRECAIVPV